MSLAVIQGLKIATATPVRAAVTAGTGGTALGYTSQRLRSMGGGNGGGGLTTMLLVGAAAVGGYLYLEGDL